MRHRSGVCVIALVCALAVPPSVALADVWTPVVPPCSLEGTLTLSPPPTYSTLPPSAFAGFAVQLYPGRSFTATLTTGPGVAGTDFRVTTRDSDYSIVADAQTGTVRTLSFAGQTPQTALLMISSSAPGTFTLDLGETPPLRVCLGALHAPGRAKRRRAFWVDAKLSDYNGFTSPVRFMIDRKVRGRWRGYSSALGQGDSTGESWHYFAKLRLQRGTFRVRARFKDAAHPSAQYNGWKTIVVK
jgi:hypothetical protein